MLWGEYAAVSWLIEGGKVLEDKNFLDLHAATESTAPASC